MRLDVLEKRLPGLAPMAPADVNRIHAEPMSRLCYDAGVPALSEFNEPLVKFMGLLQRGFELQAVGGKKQVAEELKSPGRQPF